LSTPLVLRVCTGGCSKNPRVADAATSEEFLAWQAPRTLPEGVPPRSTLETAVRRETQDDS
jgi:hypothetical protein